MSHPQQPEDPRAPKHAEIDTSKIPAFDRAMRGLIQIPKAELDARIKRDVQQKQPRKK